MTKKKKTFIGIQIPENISRAISKDAEKHYRSKSRHIIWILDNYLCGIYSDEANNFKNSYTKEDIQNMKDTYYNEKKSNKEDE